MFSRGEKIAFFGEKQNCCQCCCKNGFNTVGSSGSQLLVVFESKLIDMRVRSQPNVEKDCTSKKIYFDTIFGSNNSPDGRMVSGYF